MRDMVLSGNKRNPKSIGLPSCSPLNSLQLGHFVDIPNFSDRPTLFRMPIELLSAVLPVHVSTDLGVDRPMEGPIFATYN